MKFRSSTLKAWVWKQKLETEKWIQLRLLSALQRFWQVSCRISLSLSLSSWRSHMIRWTILFETSLTFCRPARTQTGIDRAQRCCCNPANLFASHCRTTNRVSGQTLNLKRNNSLKFQLDSERCAWIERESNLTNWCSANSIGTKADWNLAEIACVSAVERWRFCLTLPKSYFGWFAKGWRLIAQMCASFFRVALRLLIGKLTIGMLEIEKPIISVNQMADWWKPVHQSFDQQSAVNSHFSGWFMYRRS